METYLWVPPPMWQISRSSSVREAADAQTEEVRVSGTPGGLGNRLGRGPASRRMSSTYQAQLALSYQARLALGVEPLPEDASALPRLSPLPFAQARRVSGLPQSLNAPDTLGQLPHFPSMRMPVRRAASCLELPLDQPPFGSSSSHAPDLAGAQGNAPLASHGAPSETQGKGQGARTSRTSPPSGSQPPAFWSGKQKLLQRAATMSFRRVKRSSDTAAEAAMLPEFDVMRSASATASVGGSAFSTINACAV